MCGAIDPGHTYDEYFVLLAKSGMTIEELKQRLDHSSRYKVFFTSL
jgi:hypothetical protein